MADPPRVELSIDPSVARLVRVGVVAAAPIAVEAASVRLEEELDALADELRVRWAGRQPAEIPSLAPARELYKAFGIDPTRTRPSSEALLRRVLKGQPIPRISNAVDVCNLCSLRFLLSIGLYDRREIRGRVVLRSGREGEEYAGIRKDVVRLAGRPALVDDDGPFGNPSSDSARTAVSSRTTALWMIVFAPASYPGPELEAHVAFARAAMARHLEGASGPVETDGGLLG